MDDPAPVPSGTLGTVTHIDQWGASPRTFNIHVKWDNGQTLALLETDKWETV